MFWIYCIQILSIFAQEVVYDHFIMKTTFQEIILKFW